MYSPKIEESFISTPYQRRRALTANLADIIEEIVGNGRREGGCLKFRSPFRMDERIPSFAVYPSTNTWFDWGMGIGGDIIEFFRKWRGCSYKEALCEVEHFALAEGSVNPPAKPALPAAGQQRVKASLSILRDGKGELPGGFSHARCFVVQYGRSRYLAFPCPNRYYPEGLECRRISGNGARRLTFGRKSLWIQQGESHRSFVVCESIFDCLASACFLHNSNLLALNSVSNWHKAVDWLNTNAGSARLALDDDDPGRQATALMRGKLTIPCTDISDKYSKTGVKDFYRLLQKNKEEKWKN